MPKLRWLDEGRLDEAIPLFEELGDDRALSRAWRQVGYVRGAMQGRCAEWLEASERAVEHYRRSGWSESGCLSELAAALYYGPTPVSEGIARCTTLLEETTDRNGRAHVLVFLGALHAFAENLEEALEVLGEGEVILRELGETYALRTLDAEGLRRAAADDAASLTARFGSPDPAAWRAPRAMVSPEVQGLATPPPIALQNRGTFELAVELGR